jgi:hypothetical protein
MKPLDYSEDQFSFYDDESFNGAVARWAADAWIERMLDVTRVAGVEWGHVQTAAAADEKHIRALAAEMEVDPDELLKRAMPNIGAGAGNRGLTTFNGLILPVTLIEKKRRRFAPAALRAAPYHRALWNIRLFPCCLETGQILLDRCGSEECEGRALGWRHTLGIDSCEFCMTDLTASETAEIPVDLVAQLCTVADLFSPTRRGSALSSLPAAIAVDDGQVAIDLLLRLLPVVDPSLRAFRNRLQDADPLGLAKAVAASWKMMRNWPQGFSDLVTPKVAGRAERHRDGNRGETIRFLKTGQSSIVSAVLAGIIGDLRNEFDLRGEKAEEIAQGILPIKTVGRILGMGTAEVARLRRAKVLSAKLVLDEMGRLQPMFDRHEIENIAKGISSRLGVDSLAWKLGMSRNGAEQLVETGLLELLHHPFFLARYGIPQVTEASIDAVLGRLDRVAVLAAEDKLIPLSTAIKVIGGKPKPWGAIFGKLLDGSLPFRIEPGAKSPVRRIFISRKDLSIIEGLGAVRNKPNRIAISDLLSKADAGEILNVGPHEVTELFADVPTRQGERAKCLPMADVISLGRRHITSAELGLRRNVSVQKAYRDALLSGVPYLGPAGFCRASAVAKFLI